MNRESSIKQRRELRRNMRERRRALSAKERARAARVIARHIAHTGWLKPGVRMAVYLATAEEISCLPLIERALQRYCKLYLPKITSYRQRTMHFAPTGDGYRRNRFGIAEPRSPKRILPHHLQNVFVPLVAFDAQGHRLGMGGGYYDRLLQRRLRRPHSTRPRIIGIAHSTQRLNELPSWPTDVPLDAIVTEQGVEVFHSRVR
jgi:5-formyltetrahydrofolate cyclo-ligase